MPVTMTNSTCVSHRRRELDHLICDGADLETGPDQPLKITQRNTNNAAVLVVSLQGIQAFEQSITAEWNAQIRDPLVCAPRCAYTLIGCNLMIFTSAM
jgi:hypothetical protein